MRIDRLQEKEKISSMLWILFKVLHTTKINLQHMQHTISLTISFTNSVNALKQQTTVVISSAEMMKPHWLKSIQVTDTINAYGFFYTPTNAKMNVNKAFHHHNIVLQIPKSEKWNEMKTLCYQNVVQLSYFSDMYTSVVKKIKNTNFIV